MGNNRTRLCDWSVMTAKFRNWSIATEFVVGVNVTFAGGGPGKPYDFRVLKGLDRVSTIEIVLLMLFKVRMPPVNGFSASEVGLIPTWTVLDAPLSGLNELTTFPPLETA